jgi:hypothetical protein
LRDLVTDNEVRKELVGKFVCGQLDANDSFILALCTKVERLAVNMALGKLLPSLYELLIYAASGFGDAEDSKFQCPLSCITHLNLGHSTPCSVTEMLDMLQLSKLAHLSITKLEQDRGRSGQL